MQDKLMSLHVKNIGAFADIEVILGPGINIVTGPASSGKTHLLKILYATMNSPVNISTSLAAAFDVVSPSELIHQRTISENAVLEAYFSNSGLKRGVISPGGVTIKDYIHTFTGRQVILIPSIEVLSLVKLENRPSSFIPCVPNSVRRLFSIIVSKIKRPSEEVAVVQKCVSETIHGSLETTAYLPKFRTEDKLLRHPSLLSSTEARLGLLYGLLNTGTCDGSSIFLLDNPDTGLDAPSIISLAAVLTGLGNLGAQIVLTTQSYILVQYLLLMQHIAPLQYILLEKDDNGTICASSSKDYSQIASYIDGPYTDLYDLKINKQLNSDQQ